MHSRHHSDGHHHGDHTHSAFSNSAHHSQVATSHAMDSQEKGVASSGNEEKKQLQAQQVFIVMIVFCVVLTIIASLQLQNSPPELSIRRESLVTPSATAGGSLSSQLEQYNRLVSRAQELVKQYKTLSGQTQLPPELSFQFTSNPITNEETSSSKDSANSDSNLNKKQKKRKNKQQSSIDSSSSSSLQHDFSHNKKKYASNPRDLVLGMAYDVDAKNIAIFVKSLRK